MAYSRSRRREKVSPNTTTGLTEKVGKGRKPAVLKKKINNNNKTTKTTKTTKMSQSISIDNNVNSSCSSSSNNNENKAMNDLAKSLLVAFDYSSVDIERIVAFDFNNDDSTVIPLHVLGQDVDFRNVFRSIKRFQKLSSSSSSSIQQNDITKSNNIELEQWEKDTHDRNIKLLKIQKNLLAYREQQRRKRQNTTTAPAATNPANTKSRTTTTTATYGKSRTAMTTKTATPYAKTRTVASAKTTRNINNIPQAVKCVQIPPKKEGLAMFDSWDGNGTGRIGLAELEAGVNRAFPELLANNINNNTNNKTAIYKAYKSADRSGNGFINRNEFGYFLRFLKYYTNLWSVFLSMDDTDNDGGGGSVNEKEHHHNKVITRTDFDLAAPKVGDFFAPDVFDQIDTNKKGHFNFDQFCRWMAMAKPDWGGDEKDVKTIVEALSVKSTKSPVLTDDQKQTSQYFSRHKSERTVADVVERIEIPSREEAMKIFDELDGNKSGRLSLADIDASISTIFPQVEKSKPAILKAYRSADKTFNGFINRNEFGYFLRFVKYYHNLWAVFKKMMGQDGDRVISREEFHIAATKTDFLSDEMFDAIDTAGHGVVTFDDFCHWMAVTHTDWGDDEEEVQRLVRKLSMAPKTERETLKYFAKHKKRITVAEAMKTIEIGLSKSENTAIFNDWKGGGTGRLSLAELQSGISRHHRELDSKAAVFMAFRAADKSSSGFIQVEEFSDFMRYVTYYNYLWNVFVKVGMIDEDGDKVISRAEFQEATKKTSMFTEDMFDIMDTDKEGVVQFHQFCDWFAIHRTNWGADQNEVNSLLNELSIKLEREKSETLKYFEQHNKNINITEAMKKTLAPSEEECNNIFDDWDGDKTGHLSLAELESGMCRRFPDMDYKSAIFLAYRASDKTMNGLVDRVEFRNFLRYARYYSNLWIVFSEMALIDDDGDEVLSKAEFVDVTLKTKLFSIVMFDEMDTSNEGVVRYRQFCDWMAANKPAWGSDEEEVNDLLNDLDVTLETPRETLEYFATHKREIKIAEAAKHMPAPSESICMSIFDDWDGDKTGNISFAELISGVQRHYPEQNQILAIFEAYRAADLNSSGYIEREEFMKFIRYVMYYNVIWRVFARVGLVSEDGDKVISRKEFIQATRRTQFFSEDMFDSMDTEKQGVVQFHQFCNWMAGYFPYFGINDEEIDELWKELN